jgi:uncharacterized protein YndB with AHSA1/START domain
MAITRHQYRIYVKAPIERVWEAVLDPAFTRRYFHGTAFEAPPVAGQPYRTSMADGRPAVDGTIEVLEPPHRLVMTWHVLYDAAMEAEPPSRVEWTLSVAGEQLTQVDLVHGDLARSPLTWEQVRMGWVWVLDGLKTLVETGEPLPPMADTDEPARSADDIAGEWHRAQGIECNNSIWELIGKADRTADDDEEMLRRAYASVYHWQRAARRGPENEARGVYMVSKVQLLVGQPALALHYADRCIAQCAQHGLVDFDLAYAHEVRARALHALGRQAEAEAEWAAALAVPIADPEDKAIVDADFADGL